MGLYFRLREEPEELPERLLDAERERELRAEERCEPLDFRAELRERELVPDRLERELDLEERCVVAIFFVPPE